MVAVDGRRSRALIRSTVTKLAVVVPTPTVRLTVTGQAAGVLAVRRERRENVPSADGDWREAIGHRAVPELASEVEAPAVRRARAPQSTGMYASGAERRKGERQHGHLGVAGLAIASRRD